MMTDTALLESTADLVESTPTDRTETEAPDRQTPGTSGGGLLYPATLMGLALFSSGAAGLINQVVWQRSLKVFLGGSETICATVVVLVFMAGLGVGSIWMGCRASRYRNPLRALGLVESILAVVNGVICGLLALNLTSSVFALQRLALVLGVPLLLLYAVLACVVLCIPCLLMGATMPLAAEVCQRNLGLKNSRLIGLLFAINTLGSVLGTVASSGYMISHLGLSESLILAAGMNLAAGVLVLLLSRTGRHIDPSGSVARVGPGRTPVRRPLLKPSREEVLAMGLGFCSLGYEMYLFRLIPLRHEPLPFTFAAVLAGFLAFWSVGAALSSYRRGPSIATALRICALLLAATIPMFAFDTRMSITGTWTLMTFVMAKSPYFIPCLFFGYMFGRVASDAAKSWGEDIGRIYAWNTGGSCAGILAMTFIGYELPFYGMVLVLALLIYAMQEYASAPRNRQSDSTPGRGWLLPLAAGIAVVVACFALDVSRLIPGQRMYSGRDGVIILKDNGDMVWNGLWHSRISRNNDHIGSNNWFLAVWPTICHPTGQIEDVCVIGTGTGITAATFAEQSTVKRVDAYDICNELKHIYHDYPAGTLNVAYNAKIHLMWQDARTGMALNPRKYDIIQTQPLYLIQAGSSLLNSVEFYQLISDRLKPGGIFCLYSNGTPEQAFVVRETADRVFRYRESFMNGYLLTLSNSPIQIDPKSLGRRLATPEPFWAEVRNFPLTASVDRILALRDRPQLPSGDGHLLVSDDRPILEYPAYLKQRINRDYPALALPRPRSDRKF